MWNRALFFSVLAAAVVSAQSPASSQKPAFQTASVKPNVSGNFMVQFIPDAPGRFTAVNAPADLLIRFAYDVPDFGVSGGPAWLNKDRFDITATVSGNEPLAARRLMLQRLFEERFMIATHIESRELPIYAMRLANRDGTLGRQLHRSTLDCSSVTMLPLFPGRISPPPRTPEDMGCGFFGMSPTTNLPSGTGGLAFRGLTMGELAKVLMNAVHQTVVDRTSLTGYYDGEFDFIAELPPPPPPPGTPNPFTAPFTSLFTVAPEQLGLKLDSGRGPVDVLVIDSIQHPVAD